MLKKLKIDRFVIAILITVLIAYFFPQLGSKNSPVPLDRIGSLGISFIFFFYGLSLSTEAIKKGLRNWKLHVLVQSSTFLLFPLIILAFYPIFKGGSNEILWLAFLFMAALPSTVSSSVVMVSIAKGNLPAAIFNASISGILGILFTPLWILPFAKPFLEGTSVSFDFTNIYLQLITEIVVPLVLGLFLRKFLNAWAIRNKKRLDLFDKAVILLIIYKSFVHSFEDNIFTSVQLNQMVIMLALVVILFFFMYHLIQALGRLLKFNHADNITNTFCGTKKSLVHGTVFSEALFGGSALIGILLLPLMIYHAVQILIISIYATKMGVESREMPEN